MSLFIFDTLSKIKREFIPLNSKMVKLYVCGPTVYNHIHLGNARTLVVFDLLYRVLIYLYGKNHVRYVRNITDIDDKIIHAAREENIEISTFTDKMIQQFHKDAEYLGCLNPDVEPRVVDHMQDIILMIEKLVDSGHAYLKDKHVYFSVKQFPQYESLFGNETEKLLHNIRIDKQTAKDDDCDFVLWKPAKDEEPDCVKFESPFGLGRPGWHIECSAMSEKYLGVDFDIHGGGIDLIFPHHTNEIAQSRCVNKKSQFANYWMHNGFLQICGQKMSKSLGNFTTISKLSQDSNYNSNILRLFLLSNHYKKPLNYDTKKINDTKKIIEYWQKALNKSQISLEADSYKLDKLEVSKDFLDAIYDDFNMARVIFVMNNYAKNIMTLQNTDEIIYYAQSLVNAILFLGLKIDLFQEQRSCDGNIKEIDKLLALRNIARQKFKWKEADDIRDRLLKEYNVLLEDNKDGSTSWKYKT